MRSKVSIKLLAILMIMAMLLSLIPVAMAEDGEVWVEADAGEGGDGSDEEIPEVPLTDTQEDIDLDEEETADVEEGIYLEAENDPLGEEQTDGDEADEGEFILFGALGSPDEVWVDASAEEPGDGSESSPFATIQEGINEVAAGGMVKVKAGTYTESVTVNKALTLESVDGAEDTTIDADGEDIAIKITADGVTVDGFTVTGANSSYEGAVFLDRVEDCTIKNNTVKDNERSGIYMKQADNNTIEDNTISGNTLGIHLERASQTGKSCNHNTIKGNTIENNSSTGISLNTSYGQVNAATGNEFLDNTIIGNGNYGFNIQGGVWVANTIEGNTISGHQQYGIHNNGGAQNNTIKGNTIDDNNRGGYSGAGIQSGDGICLKNHDSFNFDETRATFGNTIESNTITNHWNGINLAGSTWFGNGDYWHYENTIKDNTISSNNGNGIVVKASINNLIEGNTITGNSRNGISFEEEDPTSSHINGASDNTVKENKIVNNATSRGYGINASEKSTGNTAILNWWGSVNGPGEDGANGVSSNVAYDPWYADEELKTIASNKPVINVTQMTTHETIQAAINAASAGDTIEVAAGEYSDSTMTINKPLTLKGANAGTPAADGSGEAPEERGPETILTSSGPFVIKPAASNITIDGFKFTGGKGRLIDTYEDSDNLRITNCIFDTPNGAADGGVIQLGGGSKQNLQIDHNLFMGAATSNWLYLGGTNYNNLQINNNDFKGTGKGIFQTGSDFVNIELKNNYFGSGITTGVNFGSLYNPTITGNHFDGLEYVGLQIGTEGGKLYNNTFENFIGRDFGDDLIIGAGIDLFGGQWNTLTCSGLEIHDNTFTGNIQGINIRSGVGGEGEATETKIYNNRIEDCKREGIRIANSGDITGFGSFSITNNTFINNNIQVAAEPLAEDHDFFEALLENNDFDRVSFARYNPIVNGTYYGTIQGAINAAVNSEQPEVDVIIEPGDYTENVTVPDSDTKINLKGTEGVNWKPAYPAEPLLTISDGASEVTIEDLEFDSGEIENNSSYVVYTGLTVGVDKETVVVGDTFEVQIDIENVSKMRSYELAIHYDPDYVKFYDLTHNIGGDTIIEPLVENEETGELMIGAALKNVCAQDWEGYKGRMLTVTFLTTQPYGDEIVNEIEVFFEKIDVELVPADTENATKVDLNDPKLSITLSKGNNVEAYAALEYANPHSDLSAELSDPNGVAGSVTAVDSGAAGEAKLVIPGVWQGDDYTLKLNADGFLEVVIKKVNVEFVGDTQVGTEENPILLYVGDLNDDNRINLLDVVLLAQKYGQSVTGSEGWAYYDIHPDGWIDIKDIQRLVNNYGKNTVNDATYTYKTDSPYFE